MMVGKIFTLVPQITRYTRSSVSPIERREFEAVPVDAGVDHTRSHGAAIADFDRDGDLDR